MQAAALWVAALGVAVAGADAPEALSPSGPSASEAPSAAPSTAPGSSRRAPAPSWISVPRLAGRLTAADIGLVVNVADADSVALGRHYARQRGLMPEQVLEVTLPVRAELEPAELEALRERIDAHFGPRAQALALAWTRPYAVRCNSLTAAVSLGFDGALCEKTCGRSRANPVLNSASIRPLQDHGVRLSMLLAAPDLPQALALVDRGVAADDTLGLRGAPPAQVLLATSSDRARNVRATLYPPPGRVASAGLDVQVLPLDALAGRSGVVMVSAGAARIPQAAAVGFVPGALADHLTSFGGRLDGRGAQMTVLDWIAAGATASHGTVSEPCNHLQKFPHPQLLLLHYVQGATAIEAYWRSVAWPQQGLFVGEPLAAPFARR